MIIRTTAALAILITLVQADNSTKKLGAKGKKALANPGEKLLTAYLV